MANNTLVTYVPENHYPNLFLQNFDIPSYFPYIPFYRYPSSLLSSGWFVIAVCGSISVRESVKSWGYCKLMWSCCFQRQVDLIGTLTFCVCFYSLFLKLIVTCRLCVFCSVREDKDPNVLYSMPWYVIITRLVWTSWTPMSAVQKRLLNKTTHSSFMSPGGGFNITMPSLQYRKSHYDRLVSTMGFPILIRCHLYTESVGPGHRQSWYWMVAPCPPKGRHSITPAISVWIGWSRVV